MKEDYLWDRSGDPDPEIERLEKLLRGLRYDRPVPPFPEMPAPEPRSLWHAWVRVVPVWRPRFALASTAVLAILLGALWWFLRTRPTYEVVSLLGNPRIGAVRVEDRGLLGLGQWLETDASSRARIRVGNIGQVDVEPNTRISLLEAKDQKHRLSLARGVMHAMIWAPPGSFFVKTPSAEAIDLGCMYTLEVHDDGTGMLRVAAGWVAFEREGRESFVPAGASCLTRPGTGPGTPFQNTASTEFRAALEQLDFGNPGLRGMALEALLAFARKEDALTLWHLLFSSGGAERDKICSRLAALVPPPSGVSPEGVSRLDRQMLDLWWNELGLGETHWWRMWKQPLAWQR